MGRIAGARHSRYRQVAARFEALIDRGTLVAGDRVPSLRRTSATERVSLTTALQAYAWLESRGYLEARPQSGFYVRPRASRAVPEPAAATPRRAAVRVDNATLASRLIASAQDPALVPLGAACPAPALLPTRKLARLAASVARASSADTNTYSLPPGRLELRREIARRAVDWGGSLAPDDLLVTCGATEALALALRAVTSPGDVVAVESPAYFGTLILIETLGLKAVEIATDPRTGMDVGDLAAALDRHRVGAVVASPTCQNPLGSVMPDRAKQDLVRLLARRDVPLVEDDVYGDTFHGDERPRPAKAWDRGGRVLLCSSFSKALAPGYRIGWIAGGRYQARLLRLKLASTLADAALPQMAIAAFLRSGAYDHFLTRTRRIYRDLTAMGRDAVARAFPAGTRITRPAGGFVLWVEVPGAIDAIRLGEAARGAGISIAPGPMFSARGEYRSCMRLSCAHPWTPRMAGAIETLGGLVRGAGRRRSA